MQQTPPVFLQRSEPDVLDGQCRLFGSAEFATALGLADADLVGGLIADAGEVGNFTENLKQQRTNLATLLSGHPVGIV